MWSVINRNTPRKIPRIGCSTNHIRFICAPNDKVYVDNDSIDKSCLSSDHLHLNMSGVTTNSATATNCVSLYDLGGIH